MSNTSKAVGLFRPILAATIKDVTKLHFPLEATPKIDGIRCLMRGGTSVSRTLKKIPNDHIRRTLASLPDGLDGEIVCPGGYNATQSAVMTKDGEPVFQYMAFDFIDGDNITEMYWSRCKRLDQYAAARNLPFLQPVLPDTVTSVEDLDEAEQLALKAGYEGLCLRDKASPYKMGRSTLNQQWLLKLKRFRDSEAKVIGFQELMVNHNEKTADYLGLAKRSDHIDGKVPGGTLGALLCSHAIFKDFKIGTGFTADERQGIWDRKDFFLGFQVKFKYQPHGTMDRPRIPVFIGWRHPND